MNDIVQRLNERRFDSLEELLTKALTTLATTKGRAEIDQRGVGAVKFLVEKSIESVQRIRRAVLTPFPKTCACCSSSYNEEDWQELHLVGIQVLGEDRLELRACGGDGCKTTLAIPLPMVSP